MKNWKRLIVVVLALVLCLSTGTSALALGDTITWGVYSAPNGLFLSGLYSTMYDNYVLQLCGDPLFILDESAEEESYIKYLAEDIAVSSDNLTYTFKLKQGVKWHDGEDFNAEDVAFDFITQCDGAFNSRNFSSTFSKVEGAQAYYDYTYALANGTADGMEPVETVTGVKIIDDYTVSLTLSEVYAPILTSGLNGFIIYPEHIWSKIPTSEWRTCDALSTPIGTGPFKFVKYEENQYVEFVANPDYYQGAPKVEKFIYKIVNQDTAQVELINGDLDIVSMISNPTAEVMGTYENEGMVVIEFDEAGYQYMPFNTSLEKLSNPKVREGIVCAINRQGIVDSLLAGHGVVMDTPIFRGSWGYPEDLDTHAYDPERALSLLAEGGVSDTDGDGKLDFNGEQYTLSLLCPTGNKVREQVAVVVQQCLAQIGIDVTIETMEFNTMLDRAVYADDYEMCLIGMSIGLDPTSIDSMFNSSVQGVHGSNNISNWAMPELDALMEAGTQTTDAAERKDIYYQAAHLLNQQQPEAWLYTANEIRAIRPELQNYSASNSWEFINVHNWDFAE